MKTLSKKFRKENGDLYKNVKSDLDFTSVKGNKIYCKRWVGSNRHKSLKDVSHLITEMLFDLGYKYSEGNDAPRGGAEGDFIKVGKIGMKTLFSQ